MLFTNHGLTGVALGLHIDNPALLVPAAVASHLLLDAAPHFGFSDVHFSSQDGTEFRIPKVFITALVDGLCAIGVLIAALGAFPERRGHILIGWISAVVPDLLYIPETLFKLKISGKFGDFHKRIQWYERELGIITELIWLTLMSWVILHYA